MKPSFHQILESEIVDDNVQLTLVELCHACQSSEDLVKSWVIEGVFEGAFKDTSEGVFEPSDQQQWQFSGSAVQRARLAQTLAQELEINSPGIALALDLMDRIHQLEAQLTRISRY